MQTSVPFVGEAAALGAVHTGWASTGSSHAVHVEYNEALTSAQATTVAMDLSTSVGTLTNASG
jgi:hypothetical protein